MLRSLVHLSMCPWSIDHHHHRTYTYTRAHTDTNWSTRPCIYPHTLPSNSTQPPAPIFLLCWKHPKPSETENACNLLVLPRVWNHAFFSLLYAKSCLIVHIRSERKVKNYTDLKWTRGGGVGEFGSKKEVIAFVVKCTEKEVEGGAGRRETRAFGYQSSSPT